MEGKHCRAINILDSFESLIILCNIFFPTCKDKDSKAFESPSKWNEGPVSSPSYTSFGFTYVNKFFRSLENIFRVFKGVPTNIQRPNFYNLHI